LPPTVTGATSGIGLQTALELAKHSPAQIWLTGRDVSRGMQVVSEIRGSVGEKDVDVKFVELDLADFESVKACARRVGDEAGRLDLLMCNAGVVSYFQFLFPVILSFVKSTLT
jgi:retinol dehydrogenase-12